MLEKRHIQAMREVHEEIETALSDPRGFLPHQRRLMAMISLGIQHLVEIYLHRNMAISPGTQVKHNWFKLEDKKLEIRFAEILTKSPQSLKRFHEILAMAHEIETKRDDIVYGSPLDNDAVLKEKIDLFLDMMQIVKNVTGEGIWD